jgi:hypothetical protein
MPRDTDVFCIHCQQYMPRSRERAHRAKQQAPYYSPPPPIPSRLRRVFDIESEEESNEEATAPGADDQPRDGRNVDDVNVSLSSEQPEAEAALQEAQIAICEKWGSSCCLAASDDEGSDDSGDSGTSEDGYGTDEEHLDWDEFGTGSGLSAWDQLGEGYEQDAAKAGELFF